MNTFIKFMLFLVVAACVAPFIIKGQDGRPLMTLDRLKTPNLSVPKLPDIEAPYNQFKAAIANKPENELVEVYKWQDEQGVWHYADKKAQAGSGTAMMIDPGQNTVHFDAPPQIDADPVSTETSRNAGAADDSSVSLLPTPGNVSRLIDQAKGVNQLVEKRQREQERIINE